MPSALLARCLRSRLWCQSKLEQVIEDVSKTNMKPIITIFLISITAALNAQTPTPTTSPLPTTGFADFRRFLVIVEGDKGVGSGFVAKTQNEVCLFTNSHVLSGNTKLQARLLTGQALSLGALAVAEKYDISRFSQTTSNEGMEILENLDSELNIGDEVIVLGNSLGSGVVTELKGKVTGIGPELIEVDAKFVSGNSGSPIIQVKTMKLIGIATFSEMRSMESFGKDSKFNKVERRFAYRLDNVPRWHTTTWLKFARESSVLNALNERTEDIWALANDIANEGKITDWNRHLRKGSQIRLSISQWQSALGKGDASSAAQLVSEKKRMIEGVLMSLRSDLGFIKSDQFTGYNREELAKALKYRQILTEYFRSLSDQLSNDPNFFTR